MGNFKFAYTAGHWRGNVNGIPAYMGMGQVREWTLNDQVARFLPEAAARYAGLELKRIDNPDGLDKRSLYDRCQEVNQWGADYYLDIHHNAGINGGTGGGVVMFSYPGNTQGKQYRNAIYEAILAAGGLRGNRASPLQEKKYDALRYSRMPAGLLECGFMDSKTDAPVIVTEEYSKAVAYGIIDGIAKVAGLSKADAQPQPQPEQTPVKSVDEIAREVVQGVWGNGTERKQKLTEAGFDYAAVQAQVNAILQGSPAPEKKPEKSVDEIAREVIRGVWGNGAQRKQKLTEAGFDYAAVQARVNELLGAK